MSSAPRGLAPREGLGSVSMKMGRAGPPLSHTAGRRQASLGTPVPRTPTGMDKLNSLWVQSTAIGLVENQFQLKEWQLSRKGNL